MRGPNGWRRLARTVAIWEISRLVAYAVTRSGRSANASRDAHPASVPVKVAGSTARTSRRPPAIAAPSP
jgi:hypothetical protein